MCVVSVIVPIYKVENVLHYCIDSILNQTYKDFELILVDDGSPDNSGKICYDYAEKDSRIKVIHKKNGGLSDARNVGMAVATGEYISFIDSDDYVSDDFFECLLDIMNKENSDIAECSVVKFYEDNRFDEFSDDLSVKTYDTQDAMSALIAENQFHQHVWNKLYKTELVKDIPYAVGKLNEDEFWTYRVFGRANKVARINKTMYYYFQRSSSIMGVGYNIRRLDALEGKANRQKYIENNFPDLSTQAKIDLFGSCIFACQSVLKFMSGADKKKALELIRKYRKMYNLSFDEIKFADRSARKYFYLAKCNFGFCCKFRAISGIGF